MESESISDKPPSDHLLLALLAYFLCCPLGSAALYYSSETRRYNRRNERAKAMETSQKVYSFALAGIIVACIVALNSWLVLIIATFAR